MFKINQNFPAAIMNFHLNKTYVSREHVLATACKIKEKQNDNHGTKQLKLLIMKLSTTCCLNKGT